MALSVKQKVFIEEYLKTFNATQAALAAGYSPDTAHATGWENLRKPEITEAISKRLSETAMSADEVMMRLAEHARGDVGDFLTQDVNNDLIIDLPKAIEAKKTKLIKKLTQKRTIRTKGDDETTEEVLTSIEMYDAQSALEKIGRHHKLFTDKTELTGKDGEALIPVAVIQPGLLEVLK